MIGRRLRLALFVLMTIWLLVTSGRVATNLFLIATDPPQGIHWTFLANWLDELLEPVLLAAILFVLLSIDRRLGQKAKD